MTSFRYKDFFFRMKRGSPASWMHFGYVTLFRKEKKQEYVNCKETTETCILIKC